MATLFLIIIYLAFISLGLPDSLLGVSWPVIQPEYHVPFGYAGFISMVVSCGTIVSSLLSGRVLKRFGTGKVTFVSVLMTAAALMGFSFAPPFICIIILAIPLGLGAGAVDSGLNAYVAEHYKSHHMSWLHCFWGVGAMIGPVINNRIVPEVKTLEGFKNFIYDDKLMNILQISNNVKCNLRNWYNDEYNKKLLDELIALRLPNCI